MKTFFLNNCVNPFSFIHLQPNHFWHTNCTASTFFRKNISTKPSIISACRQLILLLLTTIFYLFSHRMITNFHLKLKRWETFRKKESKKERDRGISQLSNLLYNSQKFVLCWLDVFDVRLQSSCVANYHLTLKFLVASAGSLNTTG